MPLSVRAKRLRLKIPRPEYRLQSKVHYLTIGGTKKCSARFVILAGAPISKTLEQETKETEMKAIGAAALLSVATAVAGPVMAQDKDNKSNVRDRPDGSVQHRVTHHRVAYRRTYKTDQEEHQATEDLNRQYRGVPSSDAR
jgi:hypothetical protein